MTRPRISRRHLLKHAGLAGITILALPAPIPDVSGVALAQPRTLATNTLATLRAVCSRLIPTDEHGPGAAEAHAAEYIDRALRGALAGSRGEYTRGLAAIDQVAQQRFNQPFARLSPSHQDAVLIDLQDTPFFELVRGHTLQGTFCDPVYGGNANFTGWDLIGYPGVRLAVAPADQNMSTPPAPTHTSAYDSPMFVKSGIGDD